ncbi:alpha/beta hydrolase [Leptolyngbya sp. CCNP1308]|uniref:alpha/beta fold hydrolase n=1 Tax=Leptolyngbya sp. CCNP1308 TaxID=3110255 RepID=UPI002B1EFA12|nr:alpha/beta hydrolase [Leptolyngbya sp. CCNP1308]MEA5452243.1 alpha/beta hydrolase [Leptolyngbya sp. CCNP1308]
MPYINVNQVNHYYEWVGTDTPRDPSSSKPVMVFIHGWAGSARYWQSTAAALSDRYDCLLYDMRGFGRSRLAPDQQDAAAARGYELDTYADDLAELLKALNLPKVSINAHSMGASVAVYFLNQYPELVEKAILTCNGIFEYDKAAFEAFYKFGGYVVAFRPKWLGKIPLAPRFFMARFLSRPIPAAEKIAFLDDFLTADYATALGTIFTSVSKKATEVMPVEFAKITVPTLLVSGEFDKITPAELGRTAAALNPKIEYALVKNTGHFPMLEDPETYLNYVNAFLA